MRTMKIRITDLMQFLANGNTSIMKKYGLSKRKLRIVKRALREGRWSVINSCVGEEVNAK